MEDKPTLKPVVRLTKNEMDVLRVSLLKAQKGCCCLCEKPFSQIAGTPCVDHDHTTGLIRGLLCANCNRMEGEIRNRAARGSRRRMSPEEWLDGLVQYWRFHKNNPSRYIYPTHKTETEKRLIRNKRARERRAKQKLGG